MRHPPCDGVSSYRCTFVQSATLPRLVRSRASVTNSNADGRVASVTTERSVNPPIGSAPVVANSVPTEAGPSGALSVSRRVVPFCRSPAHDRWLRRSANTSKTCSPDARLSPTTRTSISRLRALAGPCLVCPPTAHLLCRRQEQRAPWEERRIGRIPYLSDETSPRCRSAKVAASARLLRWSFARTLLTWWPAVFVEMYRRCAISAFERPSPNSARTSRSRFVSVPTSLGPVRAGPPTR